MPTMEEWKTEKEYTHRYLEELEGERVKIHWHFTKKLYSISIYVPKRGWRTLKNPTTLDTSIEMDGEPYQTLVGKIVLANAQLKVSAAGKERARTKGTRNVHAWVVGTVLTIEKKPEPVSVPCGIPLRYSPFAYEEAAFQAKYYNKYWLRADSADIVSIGIRDGKPEMIGVGVRG